MQLDQGEKPQPGAAVGLGAGLRRILAPNPGPMTFWGTNTYLLGTRRLAVIDPGPQDDAHLDAILRALGPGQSISHILVTHAHLDHSPLARRLAEITGAPVLAHGDARAGRSPVMQRLAQTGEIGGGEGVDTAFAPDQQLADGDMISGDGWSVTALWTPGHFGNHMSFATGQSVLCGDVVMGWASSLVSPPDGDLTQFLASCARLRAQAPARLLPGHGAPIEDPVARIDWLVAHRRAREAAILDVLASGTQTAAEISARVYTDIADAMLPAATRNVLAHLIDLTSQNRVHPHGPLHPDTPFGLICGPQ